MPNTAREALINVPICDFCVLFENHRPSECPEKRANPQFEKCSICAEVGHHLSYCSTLVSGRRCIHCGANHHAKAFTCPVREVIVKREEETLQLYEDDGRGSETEHDTESS